MQEAVVYVWVLGMETGDAFLDFRRGASGEDQAAWALRREGFRCGVADAELVDTCDDDGAVFDGGGEGGCHCEALGCCAEVRAGNRRHFEVDTMLLW